MKEHRNAFESSDAQRTFQKLDSEHGMRQHQVARRMDTRFTSMLLEHYGGRIGRIVTCGLVWFGGQLLLPGRPPPPPQHAPPFITLALVRSNSETTLRSAELSQGAFASHMQEVHRTLLAHRRVPPLARPAARPLAGGRAAPVAEALQEPERVQEQVQVFLEVGDGLAGQLRQHTLDQVVAGVPPTGPPIQVATFLPCVGVAQLGEQGSKRFCGIQQPALDMAGLELLVAGRFLAGLAARL